jgi:hypothetical protein
MGDWESRIRRPLAVGYRVPAVVRDSQPNAGETEPEPIEFEMLLLLGMSVLKPKTLSIVSRRSSVPGGTPAQGSERHASIISPQEGTSANFARFVVFEEFGQPRQPLGTRKKGFRSTASREHPVRTAGMRSEVHADEGRSFRPKSLHLELEESRCLHPRL